MFTNHAHVALFVTRWAARITGVLLLALILVVYVGEGPPPLKVMLSPIHIGIWVSLCGLMIGWKREGWGAAVAFAGIFMMYAYERIVWHHWLGGAFPLFFIPGVLLLAAKLQAIRLKLRRPESPESER